MNAMSFIPKPAAPASFSVVPTSEVQRISALALPSIRDGREGPSGPRLPPLSPTASGKHSDSSGTPGRLAQVLVGSPRRGRRKSEGRTTATDLPEVSDERSPVAAVKEMQKHRERRRSSITFLNDDDGVHDASPPPPPVSTQLSSKSMKSMTLDDEAASSTKVHYVKKKKARSIASCTAVDKAEKARAKGDKSTSAKKDNGGGFFGILGGSPRSERIEQASERVRKIDKKSSPVHAASPPARRGSVDDGLQEGLGDWTLDMARTLATPAIEEPEAKPEMERWQLEERKLQAALERVRMGLSAIEVDPTEEEKREESQLLKELQEKNFTDRQALAYCFVKKLGSLSNAFKYFTARQAKFTKVTWETALLVLHLHVVLLTGRNKNEIFQEMSEEDQTVTKDSWDIFFAGIDLDGEAPCPPQRELSAKEEITSAGSLCKGQAGQAEKPAVSAEEAAAVPEPSHVSPRRRSTATAVAMAAATAKSERLEDDPPPSPTKLRKADRRRSSTGRRLSSEKFDTTGTTGTAESAEDDKEDDYVFLERIDEMLENIRPDSEVFNEGMSRQQKAMLMAKARERNFSAPAWKQGVLVLQEDKLSKKLREDVASLSCGLSPIHVPKSLEQFAGVVAEEEGVLLTTHRKSLDDATIVLEMLKESGSNAELQRAAEDFLDSLADGEIRSLALPATSRFRAAVVKVAKDRGLPSATAADGHLQIGNLHLFMQNVDSIIDNLEEGQDHDFGSDLHHLQLPLVREKSVKAGLKLAGEETIKIQRMAAFMLDQKGTLEEQRMLTEAAFKKYATGRLGHQIFLRRSDLNQLFVDSPLPEGERLEDSKARIGHVYDDTLQLQLDLLGQNYGLSKEYFQVFLTKASNELSWRPKPEVLEAFLEETEGKAEQSTLLT